MRPLLRRAWVGTVAAAAWASCAVSAAACRDSPPPPGETSTQGRAELQPEPSSDRLEREVRAKLSGDPDLAGGGSIVVIVDGGHVVLEGWVASVNEKTLAEADAATVSGVRSVDDRLLVRQAPPADR